MPKKFIAKPIQPSGRSKIKPELVSPDDFKNEQQAVDKLASLYQAENYAKIQKPARHLWGLVILVAILFGFAAAFVYDFLFSPEITVNGNQKVIIDKQEDVTVTSEERLQDLTTSINPVIVNFYQQPNGTSGPFYQDAYSFGSGFILTSDGWIVTSQSVLDKIGDEEYVVLTADYQIYAVTKILKDPISPALFIKIKAKDLPVAKLGSMEDVLSGQKIYGFISAYPTPKIASLHLADLQTTSLEDVVASSEKLSHFLSCREGYNVSLFGAPIVNMAGEIVAVIQDNQIAVPISYLKTAISDLAKKDKIDRAYLGVHYINLAKYPKVDPNTDEVMDKGALLSGFENLTAVIKNSPADKAGLQVGDIILTVEDELVNGQRTLAQIIQEYEPNQELKLTILRHGKERAVEVKLGRFD